MPGREPTDCLSFFSTRKAQAIGRHPAFAGESAAGKPPASTLVQPAPWIISPVGKQWPMVSGALAPKGLLFPQGN